MKLKKKHHILTAWDMSLIKLALLYLQYIHIKGYMERQP
jgi:hypothetical protein